MKLRVGSATDVGRLRSANEDALLRDEDTGLFAVADGMGGHRAGDVASSTALAAFRSSREGGAALDDAIRSANAAVFEKARENPDMRGMGTTVTAVRVDGDTAQVGHVGDSRAYLLRDGDLTQVTDDHSLVEELVREGRLTPEEAAVHPQRSIITRALGVDESVDVDTYQVDLRVGDRLLICSDGLTAMVRDVDIVEVLRTESDPEAAAQKLVDAANNAGGEDNITVLIIDVVENGTGGDRADAASAALADTESPGATGEWVQPTTDMEAADAEAKADDGADALPRRSRFRRFRRIVAWTVPVVVLILIAVTALGWYARRTYFVGLDNESVVVYRGVPGGFLGWDPTVEEASDLTVDDLSENDRDQVDDGKQFSSREGAESYLARLENKAEERERARRLSTTTTRPTTTTSDTA